MQVLLQEISQSTNFKIKNGIIGLSKNMHHSLDENLEFLLDTFCDYFLDKGIVSVEYTDIPARSNFPSVPFIKKPAKDRQYTLVIGTIYLNSTFLLFKVEIKIIVLSCSFILF